MRDLAICLMGPTASGKTALACELVQHFPFEIISIDSAMVYRGLNIGTAKPEPSLLAEIPHHLIDCIDPPESYSAARCLEDVLACCQDIVQRGKIPLLVGGTMMYFNALQQGLSALPEKNDAIREQLLEAAHQQGWDYMHTWLTRVDPVSAQRIHPHDKQRIQRALEVFQLTGKPLHELLQTNMSFPFRFIHLILVPEDRAWLHQRIGQRFSQMLAAGMIDEVRQLLQQWSLTSSSPSMRTVGYRQILAYLQNEENEASMVEKAVAATRQLAKRQLTWLRHWPQGHYFMAERSTNLTEVVEFIRQILDNS